MHSSRYKWEKHLSRFALFRSVAWVFAITIFVAIFSKEVLPEYGTRKMFPALYQFYALFCIFAYVQVMEGLKYETSREMRFFLLDSVLSAIFNLLAVSYLGIDILLSSTESKPLEVFEVSVLLVNSILLFANLFTFKTMKAKYVEFKANESKPRTGVFLSSCALNGKKKEQNVMQNLYGTKPTEKLEANVPIENIYEPQSVYYAEVNQPPETEFYEHIDSYTKSEIYSDVDAYDTIHKPESEQYDKVDFL